MADVVSHFAVAADCIRRPLVRPRAFGAFERVPSSACHSSTGRVESSCSARRTTPRRGRGILRAWRGNSAAQRPVERIGLGALGHTALLADPARFVAALEPVLA